MQINALLDAGLRRHDEIMVATAIFNKLLGQDYPRTTALSFNHLIT